MRKILLNGDVVTYSVNRLEYLQKASRFSSRCHLNSTGVLFFFLSLTPYCQLTVCVEVSGCTGHNH